MLAPRQDHTAQRDHALVADRIANDGKCLLSNLICGRDIIRGFDVAIVDLRSRDKSVDRDGVGAFNSNLLDLLVLDLEVLPLANLVAATNVLLLDRLGCFGIDELLLQPVSGLFVDPVERNSLRARRGRIEGNGTRNQRKLEVTLPGSTRGHGTLLTRIYTLALDPHPGPTAGS